MKNQGMTVVMVHGAWADGSSWAKVIISLAQEGIRALTAPLPLSSFDDDVKALNSTITHVSGPVLLVGHAYAGAVIGATQATQVKGLVYVAALAPDEGETVADVFYRGEPHPKAPKLAPDANGLIWLPEEAFAQAFAQNATREELMVLQAVQRPISPACITVKMQKPLWRSIQAHYLITEEDRMIVQKNQTFMAERMNAKVTRIQADHTPIVTDAASVVKVIQAAIAEAN